MTTKPIFIHNIIFRVFAPPIYGLMAYIMVLLMYDRTDQLLKNFFSQEVLLCIGQGYLLSEGMRAIISILDRYYKITDNAEFRIFIQLILNSLYSIVNISGTVALYFTFILGYTSFNSELITINAIYLVITLLYNTLYLAVVYLNKENTDKLLIEKHNQQAIEYQLEVYKNSINPDLLYNSLETLISLAYKDADQSEKYTNRIAQIYRYVLDNQHNELVDLSKEINAVENLIYLTNFRYHGNISFNSHISDEESILQIMPNSLQEAVSFLIKTSIISDIQPLKLSCYTENDDYIVVKCRLNQRLIPQDEVQQKFENIRKAYLFYTSKPVVKIKANNDIFIKLPILCLEELHEEIL